MRLTGKEPSRLTPSRLKVLKALADGFARPKAESAREAGVSVGVIDGLVDDGVLDAVVLPPAPAALSLNPQAYTPQLSPQQAEVAATLRQNVQAGQFSVHVLDGVTGSGKTEVYCEAAAEALAKGQQVLVLMPEIALTGQVLDRLATRFGNQPAPWHSGVGKSRRAALYRGVASGDVQMIVGARSALFLPFAKLGLIIVDEEHEGAYKQDDGAHYHAETWRCCGGVSRISLSSSPRPRPRLKHG